MHPQLFEVGGHIIHTYGVMIGSAMFVGLLLAARTARRERVSVDLIWDVGIVIMLSAILGSRAEYVRTRWSYFAEHPREILVFADGGLVFYGGLILCFITVVGYLTWRKAPVLRFLDVLCPSLAIGHAMGRFGCLMAGCCYGAPTDLWWGIEFPHGSRAPSGISLHPTQLNEVAFDASQGLLLLAYVPLRPGRRIALYLLTYPVFRAFNETLRGDAIRGYAFGGVTNGMLISAMLFALGAGIAWKAWGDEPISGTPSLPGTAP